VSDSHEGNGSAGQRPVDTGEASRQLEQATHDTRVAFDCIALGELDRAHTHTITARAAVDAALTILQVAISVGAEDGPSPEVPGY